MRRVAVVLLALLVTVTGLVLALLLALRTPWGKRELARRALPLLQQGLLGRLSVGRVGGNLTRGIDLYDLELRDAEGEPAIRIAHVHATYDLMTLIRRRLEIAELAVEGAWVRARYLRDGKLNLAELSRPGDDQRGGAPSIAVHVEKIRADGEVRFEPRNGGETHAWLSAQGAVRYGPEGLHVDGVELRASTHGEALRPLVPLALRGKFAAELHAAGGPDGLRAKLVVRPPAGRLEADLEAKLSLGGVEWRGELRGDGIDPAPAIARAPHGRVTVRAGGSGVGRRGTIELARLEAEAGGARAAAHGRIALDRTPSGSGTVDLDAPDLSRLAALGVPELRGKLALHAQLERAHAHTHVDAEVSARALGVAQAKIEAVDAHLHARDSEGAAIVEARGVILPGARHDRFDTLSVAASGDPAKVALTVEGHGPGGAEIDLRLHGTPTREGGARAVDAVLDHLLFALAGERWESTQPGRLLISPRKSALALALVSPRGRASIDAHLDGPKTRAKLSVGIEGELAEQGGTLKAEARATLDLANRRRLEHQAEIALDVDAHRIRLEKLPTGLESGVADFTLSLHGTPHDPTIALWLDARRLRGRGLDRVAVHVRGAYARRLAKLTVDGELRGAPILHANAESDLDLRRVVDKLAWRDAPLRVDAEVPSYDLKHFDAQGKLTGTLRVRGTIAHPTGDARLVADALQFGQMRFLQLVARATLDEKSIAAWVDGTEGHGGVVAIDARAPLVADAPLAAHVRLQRIDLDLRSLGALREFRGRVDGALTFGGTRAQPTVEGQLALADGTIGIAAQTRPYEHVQLELAASGGNFDLRKLSAQLAGGKIDASGQIALDGWHPKRIELTAETKRFPFASGSVGGVIDAVAKLHGVGDQHGLHGTVELERATVRLPKLATGRKLQSTSPLSDVRFVDRAARRKEADQKRAASGAPAVAALSARFDAPVKIRSPELGADVQGGLGIELVGAVVRIRGEVQTSWGRVEILGRRWEIERASAAFDGKPSPDPAIDVRLTRALSAATIIVEVHGTAHRPQIALASDPPIYDQSQIVGIIVSGDPGDPKISDRSTDQKIVGAISGLLVDKIKDQIAPGLPIDVFKVEDAQGFGSGTTRVEIGKYLTDDVYVSYVHQFGQPAGLRRVNQNQAQIDWRFRSRYSIDTMYGDAGVGSIDFTWSLRF
jgi:autotransporter translocation and assembly factor TamB